MVAQVERARARGRLEGEVRAIVLDLLGVPEPAASRGAVSEWVESAANIAVDATCDASLVVLTRTLDELLAAAPAEVRGRLDQARARADVGLR